MRSKTIYTTLFALLFSASIFAQNTQETATARQTAQKEAIILALNVSNEQAETLMALDAAYQTKVEKTAQDPSLDRPTRKALFDKMAAEHQVNQAAVLTPEQRVRFEALLREKQ